MKKQKTKTQTDVTNTTRLESLETGAQTNGPTLEDRIRKRAHEIHQARGGTPGQNLDDWLQAEREIKAEPDQASDPKT